jgi:hypothetical protein
VAYTTGFRWLTTSRLNRIVGTLAAQLEIQRPLIYLRRLPLVPAFDDELIGRFTGKIFAADIIADDQEAVVTEGMSIEISSNTAPNVKIGQHLGQRLLNRIRQLEAGQMSVAGQNAMNDWDMQLAQNLLLGVRWRMNVMACAMMIDAFSYNRWGIKLTSATWGMPANLKVTVGTAWSTAATATPLSDIWNMDQVASLNYGITYDTVTMTTPDFRNMVATTEFANKATLVLGANFLLGTTAMPTKQDPRTMEIAGQVLNKRIVLDDFQFNTRGNDGTITTARALPTGTVLLSRAQDEGDGNVWDMANGVTTESVVAGMVGNGPTGLGGEQYGPIGYYTGREDLNPPDLTAWGVAKCFPRKHIPEATAVLSGV